MSALIERFIAEHCVLGRVPLVPEIAIHLARDAHAIFEAAAMVPRDGEMMPPYWAFAWPGGQATARWLLDNRDAVAGKRVVDIGAGSGIASIAAMRAGAASALAVDIDAMAVVAAHVNARANSVEIATTTNDVLGDLPAADLVLLGDLVYDPEMEVRVAALLETAAAQGIDVIVADRMQARRLRIGNQKRKGADDPVAFDVVGTYDAPLTPPLTGHPFEKARLWRLQASAGRQGTS